MGISCYLVSEGKFQAAKMPEDLIIQLCKSLRTNGAETVHFQDRSILVEGVYIPAKGCKNTLIMTSNAED